MKVDTSIIGEITAKVMDAIEADTDSETGAVRMAAVVVEVDEGDTTGLHVAFTDDRAWVQAAFLRMAGDEIDFGGCQCNRDDGGD